MLDGGGETVVFGSGTEVGRSGDVSVVLVSQEVVDIQRVGIGNLWLVCFGDGRLFDQIGKLVKVGIKTSGHDVKRGVLHHPHSSCSKSHGNAVSTEVFEHFGGVELNEYDTKRLDKPGSNQFFTPSEKLRLIIGSCARPFG